MTTLWAILAFLVLYPLLGTLMFALAEKLSIPPKRKVFFLMVGHRVLTGFIVWLLFSLFNRDILAIAIVLTVGPLVGILSSKAKFLVRFNKTADKMSIDYITPLLRHKTMTISLTSIQRSSVLGGRRLFNKPTILELILDYEVVKFYVLEQNIGSIKP
jgi:hypothetical protein